MQRGEAQRVALHRRERHRTAARRGQQRTNCQRSELAAPMNDLRQNGVDIAQRGEEQSVRGAPRVRWNNIMMRWANRHSKNSEIGHNPPETHLNSLTIAPFGQTDIGADPNP